MPQRSQDESRRSDPAGANTPSIPALICDLCRGFYSLGWVSGTGGGISIRGREGIYMAPSGVQKERIRPEDVFLLDGDELERAVVLRAPSDPSLRISECRPLFYNAFRLRGAGAVMHSHSIWAVLAARLFAPDGGPAEFCCQGLEMQKGLRGVGCFDELRVPIIRNTAREAELTESMEEAMRAYPDVDAVLVAGHGVYVWGDSWIKAKTQAECYDYLFRAVVEAYRVGLPLPGTPTRRAGA
ncbi:MAG: methylthioribulose 1-phosphate dehydratase [Myxococcales bacterium]|nr:methylthioribulose 1-phosphate dehydratase [Myxococcales bacterium]MCB9752210.1 methylthioribulose 1-phosphate dehydratase [Myxococcales bacterium]